MMNLKVLLVDDNKLMREFLASYLTTERARVTAVSDGQEAVERLCEETHTFDLILSDVEMPRLDGWGLLEWVREHEAALPVVLMSALSPGGFVNAAHAKGANGALPKPFQIRRLHELLIALFDFAGRPRVTEFYCPLHSAA